MELIFLQASLYNSLLSLLNMSHYICRFFLVHCGTDGIGLHCTLGLYRLKVWSASVYVGLLEEIHPTEDSQIRNQQHHLYIESTTSSLH